MEIHDSHDRCHHKLGWLLVQAEQSAEAVPLLTTALRTSNGHPVIAYHLAVALNDIGKKQQALENVNLALAVEGDFAEREAATELLRSLSQ